MRKILKKLTALILCGALISCLAEPLVSFADETDDETTVKDEVRIMVSLGDSYSSGEGIEPFYGQAESIENKINNEDWLAHRSQLSWPGQLKISGLALSVSNYRNKNWYFAASSGAVTDNLYNSQEKPVNRENVKVTKYLDPQLDIFDEIPENETDYVTLTFGGNDVGFVDVVTEAVWKPETFYFDSEGLNKNLEKKVNEFYDEDGIGDKLKNAYEAIREKAGDQAKILVAGYPKLLSEGTVIPCLFRFGENEAAYINEKVSWFNEQIRNIVENDCDDNFYFISVEEEFEGHEAYSDDAWINPVLLVSKTDNPLTSAVYLGNEGEDLKYDITSAYSIHPNQTGAEHYAACVQQKINEIEQADLQENYDEVFNIGDTVTFGNYEGEDIEWTVADARKIDDDTVLKLLISKDVLFDMPYNDTYEEVTWETSSLRDYLNGGFLTSAFTENERNSIVTTIVETEDTCDYEGLDRSSGDISIGSGGNSTYDKLFLPSLEEAERYSFRENAYQTSETWWLRSPGVGYGGKTANTQALTVSLDSYRADGSSPYAQFDVNCSSRNIGVRPMMWVSLESEISEDTADFDPSESSESPDESAEEYNIGFEIGDTCSFGDRWGDVPWLVTKGTSIDWVVVDIQDNRMLLLSEYTLLDMAYNDSDEEVSWENCSLRSYLNNEFLTAAFSEEGLKHIPETEIVTDGVITYDKVFLESAEEAAQYDVQHWFRVSGTVTEWLRSSARCLNDDMPLVSSCVRNGTTVDSFGNSYVRYELGVRPMIWYEFFPEDLE